MRLWLVRHGSSGPKVGGSSGGPIAVRPIREMTGNVHFDEVFLLDARIPAVNLVGEENGGLVLARITLSNERVSLSPGGVVWGMGPTTGDLVAAGRCSSLDRLDTDRLMAVHVEAQVIRLLSLRILSALISGRSPDAEPAVKSYSPIATVRW